jgi:hypothetical protein
MMALNSTDEWGCDGVVSVELNTGDAATGAYTFELNDGKNTVAEEDELVETGRRRLCGPPRRWRRLRKLDLQPRR